MSIFAEDWRLLKIQRSCLQRKITKINGRTHNNVRGEFILRLCHKSLNMKIIDASEPDFSKSMTENEARDFLINSTKNIHISTLDEKGEPNIHPTWYYFDDNNEKIYIESGKDSRKTRNLKRNNIIYYCIDDDTIPYKGVRGKGTVKISEDVNYNLPIINKIVTKYLGSTENQMAKAITNSIRNGSAVLLEISPRFYATWNHGK
jgi:general stress protein 26